ncbi:MAG: DUF937 domain-containing protein [Eubacteriaceae bacterium]|nr:DUF937 domain-containing protein [Eubacteriaceae bacterium]
MDLSAILAQILADKNVEVVSKATGVGIEQIKDLATQALPILLNGISNLAKDSNTSGSLMKTLSEYAKFDISDIAGFLSKVDLAEGAKIIGQLLGKDQKSITEDLSKKIGLNSDTVTNLLSQFAPLVMTLIGQQTDKIQSVGNGIGAVASKLFGGGAAKTDKTEAASSELVIKLLSQILGG